MNILFVTRYRNFSGGVESVNHMLQLVFEENGYRVDYLTAEGSPPHVFMRALKRIVGPPAVTASAYRNLNSRDYDLVIANGEFAWGIDHPKTICLFHGSYRGFRDYLKSYLSLRQYLSLSWHARIQRAAAQGKAVVTVSHFVKDILERQGIAVSKVIENSVDTDFFYPRPDTHSKTYLFVGTYHRYGKGFDVLEKLARMGFPIDCMTNIHPGKGLGFLNVVAREKMPETYGRYRILVFPSRFEAAALVPLEAMSCGLPVVMTNVGLGPEIGEAIPEFVVDVSSEDLPAVFAERIALIENRYEEFSRKAREYVLRRHSYQRFKEEWRRLMREYATNPVDHPTGHSLKTPSIQPQEAMDQREINNTAFELWDVKPKILANSFLNKIRFLQDPKNFFIYTNIPKGKQKILELGCGSGALAIELAHLNREWDIIGVDVSDKFIERSQRNQEQFKSNNTQFCLYDGSELPFDDNSFDLIYSCDVFGHIPNLQKAFYELYRILKPHGKLVAFSESELHPSMRIVNFLKKNGVKLDESEQYHISIFPKQKLNEMLGRAGFKKLNFFAPFKSRFFLFPEWYVGKLKGTPFRTLYFISKSLHKLKKATGPVGILCVNFISILELFLVGRFIETGGIFLKGKK